MIECTNCMKSLKADIFNSGELSQCPYCSVLTQVDAFPALIRELPSGMPGETLLVDDEASCFYHPQKKAAIPCSSCGRFLCSLCDVELNGKHLCLACLETGKKKKKIKNLENHRTLYDSIALSLAVLPMVIFYFTIITAPMVIFMVIRYWKEPSSIVQRTKLRLISAFIIAGLQITGWSALIYFLVMSP